MLLEGDGFLGVLRGTCETLAVKRFSPRPLRLFS